MMQTRHRFQTLTSDTGFRNKQYLPHALHKIMREFYSLSQGKHRSNQEHYDEFNSLVRTAIERGATIGLHLAGVDEVVAASAANTSNPTAMEHATAEKMATERYLTVSFLLGADCRRYGTLIEEIENEFLQNKGSASTAGTYLTTTAEAYNYLCNYKKDPKNIARLLGNSDNLSSGVAFTQDGTKQDDNNTETQEQAFATNSGNPNNGNTQWAQLDRLQLKPGKS